MKASCLRDISQFISHEGVFFGYYLKAVGATATQSWDALKRLGKVDNRWNIVAGQPCPPQAVIDSPDLGRPQPASEGKPRAWPVYLQVLPFPVHFLSLFLNVFSLVEAEIIMGDGTSIMVCSWPVHIAVTVPGPSGYD